MGTEATIEPILIVAIVIVCTAWYMRHRWRKRLEQMEVRRTSGLELLAKRYARGDIDREEYLVKRDDLLGTPRTAAAATESQPTP